MEDRKRTDEIEEETLKRNEREKRQRRRRKNIGKDKREQQAVKLDKN
jgi:hypothetical protein